MISIIVIGKNEGSRLIKCINSISIIIQTYKNLKFELIYVDSNSIDNSIELLITLIQDVKIFKIIGETNAAIARNIGAKESSGDILFFVDGDMELDPDFLKHAITKDDCLNSEVITGHLDDYFYNNDNEYIGKSPRTYTDNIPEKIELLDTNGGIFIINRKVWEQLNGMNPKFKVNEDIDFSLRLNKINIKIQRLPYLITKHHTIDYYNEQRMWKDLKSGYGLYPGMILRAHLFTSQYLLKVIRSQYTALVLLMLIFTIPFKKVFLLSLVFYLILLAMRILTHTLKQKTKKNNITYFFSRFSLQVLLDMSFWLGLFFYYPKNTIEEYNLVN